LRKQLYNPVFIQYIHREEGRGRKMSLDTTGAEAALQTV